MVLGTIGLLLTMGAVTKTAEKRSMNAYPTLNKDGYDKHNALRGINIHEINKIAARNGVRCDKHGVLPENGWTQCLKYVKQYANTVKDVEDFPKVWLQTVQQQLDEKHKKIAAKQQKKHDEFWADYWARMIATKTNETTILQYKHWYGLSHTEHMKRLNEMMETDWKQIVANGPILRPVPETYSTHLEVWEVYKLEKFQEEYKYDMNYEHFCKLCGYDPQL